MCLHQELESGVVDLLIHTPNSFADVGSNTDRCTFKIKKKIKTFLSVLEV